MGGGRVVNTPDTLIIGAGAVGQVFAAHLAARGARIAFMTRRARDIAPLEVHRLRRGGRIDTRVVTPLVWIDAPEAVEAWADLQAVWLCAPANSLRDPRVQRVLETTGDATVVSITPALRDRGRLCALVGPERFVIGAVAFMAWQSPAPGLPSHPGVCWWMPPLGACPFDGPRDRVRPVVDTLHGAGLRAVERPGRAAVEAQWGSAVLMPLVVGLELADWSFDALFSDSTLTRQVVAASREALAIASAHEGVRAPAWRIALGPTVLRTVAGTRRFAPFSVEAFFRFHFVKVGEQTMLMLDDWIAAAAQYGVSATALARLRDRLAAHRANTSPPANP